MARVVSPDRYRRQHTDQHEIMVNVRLRAVGARMPTEDEIRSAWAYTREHDGVPPRGWQVAAVDWQHGSGSGWHGGDVDDLAAFQSVVDALGGWDEGAQLGEPMRIGVERRDVQRRGAASETERFYLSAGESSGKYRPGQWVSVAYAERFPWKVTRVLVASEGGEDVDDADEGWEVEIAYDY